VDEVHRDQRRLLRAGRLTKPRRALLATCAAALAGLAAPAAHAAVAADSVGIYSEEHERSGGGDRVRLGEDQRDAGIGLLRQPFLWSRIETAPGVFDFSVYDDVVASAAFAGLHVLPVLLDAPPWRSTGPPVAPGEDMYPPAQADAFATLAGALVRRYGPGGSFWAANPDLPVVPFHSWQVWNEPNTSQFWATGPDPAAYTRLLRAAAAAIRAADPGAEVVAAGLPESLGGTPVATYLDGMYDAGARGSFDTLAIHPYARDPEGALDILRGARAELDRHGDAQKPIWATEFGWASAGPASLVTTSEASQATRVRDTIVLMQRARSALRLRGFVVFRWIDKAPNAGQQDSWPLNTGLLRSDGSAKPALRAFRDAIAVWRREPSPQLAEKPASAGGPSSSAAARARALKIGRYVSRGRLYVRVDVAPGRGGRPVKISYRALRKSHIRVRRTRSASTRKRVARVVFRLPRSARSADLLRIVAVQGSARATRDLRLRPRRRSARR
jgi:hypothetical protein